MRGMFGRRCRAVTPPHPESSLPVPPPVTPPTWPRTGNRGRLTAVLAVALIGTVAVGTGSSPRPKAGPHRMPSGPVVDRFTGADEFPAGWPFLFPGDPLVNEGLIT